MKMIRLAFISWHPAPYRDPFLRRLVKLDGVDTTVFNIKPVDTGHPFWNLGERGYDYIQLTNVKTPLKFSWWRIFRFFVLERYDVIALPVFMKVHFMILAVILHGLGRKYVVLSDSNGFKRVNWFYEWIRRYISQRAALMMVQGKAGKDLFVNRYGVVPERFMYGVYALESKKFERDVLSLRGRKIELRRKFGLEHDDRVFLMVANMVENRHYPITCTGFSAFNKQHPNCKFVICGRGRDLEKMQSYARSHPEIIVVPGCAFEEMKSLYAMADVYVHGGTEPASTALIFGAISHLPLLSTYAVGCSADVLSDGMSGVDVGDYLSADAWQKGFEKMLQFQSEWSKMGEVAREASCPLDADIVVDRFSHILKKGCERNEC